MTDYEKLIARINELTELSRTRDLTEDELHERQACRETYMKTFRSNFKSTLDNTVVEQDDGAKVPLKDWNETMHKEIAEVFEDDKNS